VLVRLSINSEHIWIQLRKITDTEIDDEDFSSSQDCKVCNRTNHKDKLDSLKDTVSHLKLLADFTDNDLKHDFELRQVQG
jgi:hypothetical protein